MEPSSLGGEHPSYTITKAWALEKSLHFHPQMTDFWPNRALSLSREINGCVFVILFGVRQNIIYLKNLHMCDCIYSIIISLPNYNIYKYEPDWHNDT